MYLQTKEGEEVAFKDQVDSIRSDYAFEGFLPQCGRCCAAGRAKQKVTLFCLIFPQHGNPSQVVRSLWIVGKGRLIMDGLIVVITCWEKEKIKEMTFGDGLFSLLES